MPNSPTTFSLAAGGRCVKLGVKPQEPYANVRATADHYAAHSETMVVEDPTNPLHLVGGAKFFPNISQYSFQVGYVSSFDGGCSWHDGGILPGFAASSTVTSDPSFAFGLHNKVYASVLNDSDQQSGISIYASSDGGKTFASPVSVYQQNPDHVFSDKPWITVDQTHSKYAGNIYVAWSYDHGDCGVDNYCSQEMAFSRSSDGGKSFSPVKLIDGHASFCINPVAGRPVNSTLCDGVLGATPIVQPDGSIIVVGSYQDTTGQHISDGTVPTRLLEVTSHDGGNTWSDPQAITFVNDVFGVADPDKFRTATLPGVACDPHTGQLYITWADKSGPDADILFETSSDSGRTWSLPMRVNDDPPGDGVSQSQPQIAVAPDGVVSISFFDTRRDPQHKLIDVYLAQSINHGESFLKNVRVTSQSWDPGVNAPVDGNGLQFLGDYQGLAAGNLFVHPFWNDTRTGNQEIFSAAVPSAQPQ